MRDYKDVTIKITRSDAIYKMFYLKNGADDDPNNDEIIPIQFTQGPDSDIASLALHKNQLHIFQILAMGRIDSTITVEIPEVSFKKPYKFGSNRQITDTLSLPIF